MHGAGGNVAALAGAVGGAAAAHDQGQLAVENDVRCLGGVGVVGIAGVRAVLPDVGVREAFGAELLREFCCIVHALSSQCSRVLSRSFLWREHARGDARDQTARRQPLRLDAEPVARSGDHARLSGGQRLQSHARHFFRGFLCRRPCAPAGPRPRRIRSWSIRGRARRRSRRGGATSSAMPSAKSRSKPLVAA